MVNGSSLGLGEMLKQLASDVRDHFCIYDGADAVPLSEEVERLGKTGTTDAVEFHRSDTAHVHEEPQMRRLRGQEGVAEAVSMPQKRLMFRICEMLEGKVAFITGGASGIGAATARLFVQHGAKYKRLAQRRHSLSIPTRNFDVNVVGAFFCVKHAARVMIPANIRGAIVFTASAATVCYGTDVPHTYSASKNALLGFAKNVGVELGEYGIKVNCVSPYFISTPLVLNRTGIDKQMADKLFAEAGNLKGALLNEEEVAKAVLYLVSDDSKYVSGMNLVLDGGFSTTNVALTTTYNKLFPPTINNAV
uniref:Short-chain dehydrogenase reductase 3a-like n=1 Tax=Nicotiana tabacum TaxID=4097 RepID=A0A1S4BHQ3_TOBAC|nr:PREDICTED: short-chain dehydrogenase reductase 3a-like [Nicotiana tabacum]